jgi:predicted  nucleic acid-binding Zn-ribbon protein
MNILQKSKVKVIEHPPSRVSDLKKELRDLSTRLKSREADLALVDDQSKIFAWNMGNLQDPNRKRSAQLAIANLTERKDDLLTEISEINKDIRTVGISLKQAEAFDGKTAAMAGESEIIAQLSALVEATQVAAELNRKYYETRMKFGIYVDPHWPYSNNGLDLHQHDAWLRDARKFLAKK